MNIKTTEWTESLLMKLVVKRHLKDGKPFVVGKGREQTNINEIIISLICKGLIEVKGAYGKFIVSPTEKALQYNKSLRSSCIDN